MWNIQWNQTEFGNTNNVLKQLYTQPSESCFSIMSGSLVYITGKNKWVYSKKEKIY